MAEFDITAVRGALARGYCHRGNRHKELDSTLLESQAAEIMALVERLAEPEPEPKTSEIGVITVKLALDTADVDQEIARRSRIVAAQSSTIQRQSDMIQNQRETISAQREIIGQNNHVLQSLFERIDWRREAWNDLKAVLIRAINTRLKGHVSGDILRGFSSQKLEQVRSFIASYQFDPEKP